MDDLTRFLRPAGGGIFTVSTGRAEQEALQRRLYDAPDADEVQRKWQAALAGVAAGARGDHRHPVRHRRRAGAGRGVRARGRAARAAGGVPRLRGARGARGDRRRGRRVRRAAAARGRDAERRAAAADARRALRSGAPPPTATLAGGAAVDRGARRSRSCWRATPACASSCWAAITRSRGRSSRRSGAARVGEPWAIVHVDAHTDLLPERLGVRLCFATWAYHANELLGRGGRLVQVGVRASSRSKQHWESTLGVRQFWADEVRARGDAVIDDVIAHLRALGVARVYLSNDIDATDSATAPSTGAPEANGLAPAFVATLIARVAEAFPLLGRRRRRGGAVDRQQRRRAPHDGGGRRVYAGHAWRR